MFQGSFVYTSIGMTGIETHADCLALYWKHNIMNKRKQKYLELT